MDRRTFIYAIAGGLVIARSAAEAQQAAKIARIGYLATSPAASPVYAREVGLDTPDGWRLPRKLIKRLIQSQ